MRIVTWNMDSRRPRHVRDAAWDFLLTELRPDIALVQEARVPSDTGYEVLLTEALWRGESLRGLGWGSAILSRVGKPATKLQLLSADIAERGAVQIAACAVAGLGELTIANVHSRLDAEGKVIPNLKRTLDVLLPVLGERFIVGGDLNTARSLVNAYKGRGGHAEFWSEVDGGKLREALPGGDGERQSYWGHGDMNPGPTGNVLQDDHLFFDAETVKLVEGSRVWDTPHVRTLSDHGPVVVDLLSSAVRASDYGVTEPRTR